MVLEMGMKRQIRLMCRALGSKVRRLVRVRIGSYEALDLEPGEAREMEEGEIAALLRNPGKVRQPAKKRVVAGGQKKRDARTAAARKKAAAKRATRGPRGPRRKR